MSDPRYPIGKFTFAGTLTNDERLAAIEAIENCPLELRKGAPRPGGRTARHSLPRGWLDGTPVGPPCCRQPRERLLQVQAGADGREPNH